AAVAATAGDHGDFSFVDEFHGNRCPAWVMAAGRGPWPSGESSGRRGRRRGGGAPVRPPTKSPARGGALRSLRVRGSGLRHHAHGTALLRALDAEVHVAVDQRV